MGESDINYVNMQSAAQLFSSQPYESDYYYVKTIQKKEKAKNPDYKPNIYPCIIIFIYIVPPAQNKYFQICLNDFQYIEQKRLTAFSKKNSALGIPHAVNIYQPRKVLDLDKIESSGFVHISWALKRQVEVLKKYIYRVLIVLYYY